LGAPQKRTIEELSGKKRNEQKKVQTSAQEGSLKGKGGTFKVLGEEKEWEWRSERGNGEEYKVSRRFGGEW